MKELDSIRFRLKLPPSTNALYSTIVVGTGGKRTRRISSAAARSFRTAALPTLDLIDGADANAATLESARSAYWGLAVSAFFPTPLRRDLDDILKIAIDVISEGLRLNDNRLVDLHASKYLDPREPRLEIELEAFPDWSFGDERVVLSR